MWDVFEFVLTTYISVCTQAQHVLAILSLSPAFHGLHFVGYSALLKDQSFNLCVLGKCTRCFNLCVTGKCALTFRDRCSPTKASDIAEAHWATKCLLVPTSCLPSLHPSCGLRCGMRALKIVSIRLMLDMKNTLSTTQDPQVSTVRIHPRVSSALPTDSNFLS